MLRWLESLGDLLARRIAAEGATTRCYREPEFAALVQELIETQQLSLRMQSKEEAVLLAPGRRLCDPRKTAPTLRYRLRRDPDGRLHVMVFEHVLCFARSPQAQAIQELCNQRLAGLLETLNKGRYGSELSQGTSEE